MHIIDPCSHRVQVHNKTCHKWLSLLFLYPLNLHWPHDLHKQQLKPCKRDTASFCDENQRWMRMWAAVWLWKHDLERPGLLLDAIPFLSEWITRMLNSELSSLDCPTLESVWETNRLPTLRRHIVGVLGEWGSLADQSKWDQFPQVFIHFSSSVFSFPSQGC